MGHTRLATTGDVCKRNAHPFRRGNILGTHNGWVTNWNDFNGGRDLEVDSEAIFKQLKKHDNDYKKAFKKLAGVFALAWTQLLDNDYQLFLATDGNPLHICYVADLKTYFWASTKEALTIVLSSHYVKNKVQFIADGDCLRIDSNLAKSIDSIAFKKDRYTSYSASEYTNSTYKQTCDTCKSKWIDCRCDFEDTDNDTPPLALYCDDCAFEIIQTGAYDYKNGAVFCSSCRLQHNGKNLVIHTKNEILEVKEYNAR